MAKVKRIDVEIKQHHSLKGQLLWIPKPSGE
jgi:hypothetical protein